MLRKAQLSLRRELARLEITVETNPSSNLLIGDFREIDEHPLFQLQPLDERKGDSNTNVLLSINTDDPITFATRLSDEYAYIYFALLRAGVSSRDALAWLERIRETSWRSRFTLEASRSQRILTSIGKSRP
jgi:adenosine deaminase